MNTTNHIEREINIQNKLQKQREKEREQSCSQFICMYCVCNAGSVLAGIEAYSKLNAVVNAGNIIGCTASGLFCCFTCVGLPFMFIERN
jgi:hypothetical protein